LESEKAENSSEELNKEEKERLEKEKEKLEKEKEEFGTWWSNPSKLPANINSSTSGNAVGKYISPQAPTKKRSQLDFGQVTASKKSKVGGSMVAGNFSNF
jgi:hypothetical protein